jgi:hypothetical protein
MPYSRILYRKNHCEDTQPYATGQSFCSTWNTRSKLLATCSADVVRSSCRGLNALWARTPGFPKNSRCPPTRRRRADSSRRVRSGRTARTVTRSAAGIGVGSSWKRMFATSAPGSFSARITSRRNAAFRVFDSTNVNQSDGRTIFSGSAGDPPPEPKSNQVPGTSGMSSAASSGSMNSRSNVAAVGACKGRAVRLILTFHCASKR